MSPNFWGCRCCGRGGSCIFRVLDSSGNQLWTWNRHRIWQGFGFRSDGFAVNPDGYVAHCGGSVEPESFGLIDPDGVDVWQGTFADNANGLYLPTIDDDLNFYAVTTDGSSSYLYSYDPDGDYRWDYEFTSSQRHNFGCRWSGTVIWVSRQTGSSPEEMTIAALDKDGTLLGEKSYSRTGSSAPSAPYGNYGITLDGHAVVPWWNNAGTGYIDILDDDCTVLSTTATGVSLGSAFTGIFPSSGGDVLASLNNLIRNLSTSSNEFSHGFSAWNADGLGDGDIYMVKRSGGTGREIFKSDESGTMEWKIVETGTNGATGANENFLVGVATGRVVIASNAPRNIRGWSLDLTP